MTPDCPDPTLFADALVCEELRPAGFTPGDHEPDGVRAALRTAEGLLRALSVVEDHRGDDGDDAIEKNPSLQRMEAKLDLLVALLAGQSMANGQHEPLRQVWWSATGACLEHPQPLAAGTPGWFSLQPTDWLPQPIRLPARVVAAQPQGDGVRLWLRFEPLPASMLSALERHVFRVHRRAIAELRRTPG